MALTGCVSTDVAKEQPFVPCIRTYACKRATGEICIDGKLDEPSWANAVPVDRFYEVTRSKQRIPAEKMKAWFLHDGTNLYLGAVISDRDLVADPARLNKEREESLLRGDVFELFVHPEPDKPTYYEFHVNVLNATWDWRILARRYMRFQELSKWDSRMRTAVVMDGTLNKIDEDQGWQVEIAIPLDDFTDKDGSVITRGSGQKWRISVCLYDYAYYYDNLADHDTLKHFSSSCLPRLEFHLRQYFDFLEFE